MSAEELRKAVESLDSTALVLHRDWNTVKQALRDQDAEIADIKADRDSWCDQASQRLEAWDNMRKRAEKAEALLREIADRSAAGTDFRDLALRITAHLGGENNG